MSDATFVYFVRTRLDDLARRFSIVVCRSLVLVCVVLATHHPVAAIDIVIHLDDEGENPGADPDGTRLLAVFNRAAQIWEDYLPAAGTYDVDIWWSCDLYNYTECVNEAGAPLGEWSFQFGGNNNIRVSPDFNKFDWYFDDDANHTEFDMGQKLYRDLSPASQDFWFEGSPPQLLETAYSGETNDATLENRFDLLSAALHLLGHELGVNESGGPWEANPAFLPTGSVVMKESCCNPPASGHLKADFTLMTSSETRSFFLRGRRVLPSAIDIMAVADDEGFDAIDLPRQDYVGNGHWHESAKWIGGRIPDSDDHAFLREGANVNMILNAGVEWLSMSEDAVLTTASRKITVDQQTTIQGSAVDGPHTRITVPSGGELETGRLLIDGGTLDLDGGLVDVNGFLAFSYSAQPGELSGHGTIEHWGSFISNGTIRPEDGTLLIELASGSNIDLDGADLFVLPGPGVVDATAGNLHIVGGGLADPFDGSMTIGPGHEVSIQSSWILGVDGQLTLAGQGFATSAVNGGTVVVRGSISVVSDFGVLESTIDFESTSDVTIDSNAFLFLDGTTNFKGGSFTGGGTLVQNGNAEVAVGTTTEIELFTYDLDGTDSSPATITIDPVAQLMVNAERIETSQNDGFDGTLNLQSGLLQVGTHEIVNRGGTPVREPRPWRMEGTLNLTGSARVEGSRMIVGDPAGRGALAYVNVDAGHAFLKAPVTFENTAVVTLDTDTNLSLTSDEPTIYEGGSFQGLSGNLRQSSDAIVTADTQIDVGLYDMDGALENSAITIDPGATLVVNALRIEDGVHNDFDGKIIVNGGTLDVQPHHLTFSPRGGLLRTDDPWRMEGLLQLNNDSSSARLDGNKMFVGQASMLQSAAQVTVGPGQSLLRTEVEFEQRSVLEFELGGTAGTEFGRLVVAASGDLTLGGTLEISLVDGFAPTAGDTFTVVSSFPGLSGVFDNTVFPWGDWEVNYGTNNVVVGFIGGAALWGDYNNDGTVNATDYTVFRNNEGTSNVLPNDPIGGTIGAAQYGQWKANFGNMLGSGSLTEATAPEPASALLLIITLVMACVRRPPAA